MPRRRAEMMVLAHANDATPGWILMVRMDTDRGEITVVGRRFAVGPIAHLMQNVTALGGPIPWDNRSCKKGLDSASSGINRRERWAWGQGARNRTLTYPP